MSALDPLCSAPVVKPPLLASSARCIVDRDHRPLIYELQRELRLAVLEIEKVTQASRDLTRINQELEESRLLAISDQARTAKRLLLMSSQLEYTEQKLFSLTKETEDGLKDSLKDSDLLRIERIKREALQEREDAGRLKIEALQDELREVQRSERTLQQKLLTVQTKYETLGQRHDHLRRQQQEVDLARESKEAVAWLKETTDRLCSPPQGSLGQAIQQEKSQQGSPPINIARSESPSSSSPPYPSSIVDPPLAAQNQLISLIKELATANSTLRSELAEYRDLLQDSRNEVMDLRSQIEDYEQGHGFECCGGSYAQDGPGDLTISQGTWGTAMVEHQDLSSSRLKDPAGGPLSGLSAPASTEVKPRRVHDSKTLAYSRRMRSKKSLYTDADMDMLGSESDRNGDDAGSEDDDQDQGDPAELLAELGDSGSEQEPGFVAAFAEALSFLSFFSGPLSGSPP
ncbi:hypothetical protein BGW39_008050 [Mortierella sp. 14UC]|nr:hypothetical protein BGW39_008050 [Mortierella sp. 14UC]